MNDARKRAAGLLPAALLAAACTALAPAQAAYATDYHWIGAGTGGNIATDPADPTTQWNNPANWQENKVPGAADGAYVSLANAGYANVQSGSLGGFMMSGTSLDGALHIGDGVSFSTTSALGGATVGYSGQGRIVQTGGSFSLNGFLLLGWQGTGNYLLQDGALSVGHDEEVGYWGTGTFTQTGGTHTVGGELSVGDGGTGVLNVGGGVLTAQELITYGAGTLNITKSTASIAVHSLILGGKFTAVPGSTIHIPGTICKIGGALDEAAFAGLENLAVVFDGTWSGLGGSFEVAGKDLGASPTGFNDNFALGSLVVGGAVPRNIWLEDKNDNGNRSSAEALYVHNLTIEPGSSLDLAGLHLYYDGAFINQGSVLGGSPIFVPEPATLGILAMGIAGLLRKPLKKRAPSPHGN